MFCMQWRYKATHLSPAFYSTFSLKTRRAMFPFLYQWNPISLIFLLLFLWQRPCPMLQPFSSAIIWQLQSAAPLPPPTDELTRRYPAVPIISSAPTHPSHQRPFIMASVLGGAVSAKQRPCLVVLVIAKSVQITRCDEVYRRWGRDSQKWLSWSRTIYAFIHHKGSCVLKGQAI